MITQIIASIGIIIAIYLLVVGIFMLWDKEK